MAPVLFISAFLISFLGSAIPGMVNMTGLRLSLERPRPAGTAYAAGAASMAFVQASLAVVFAHWISSHPGFTDWVRAFAVLVFSCMAVYFFLQRNQLTRARVRARSGRAFWLGVMMASLNALYVPYFFAAGALLRSHDIMAARWRDMVIFAFGIAWGLFVIMWIYARFADWVQRRARGFTRWANLTLAVLFSGLAVLQLVTLL